MASALYQSNQSIPQDMLLGNLLFMNLTDMKIPEDRLVDIFKNNNIPESYVRKISKADAFRRASSSIKNTKLLITGLAPNSTDRVHVEIDEVRNDTDSIKRIIGVKRVDETNEDIKYEPIGDIVFNRSNDTCTAFPLVSLTDPDFAIYESLCDSVVQRYTEWSVYHNKDTVRNTVNRIINDTHPTNLMPTGLCKFIPAASTDLLYHLRDALGELSAYSTTTTVSNNVMEIIPVIDTDDQRNLIEKNFTAEITDELFAFTQELKDTIAKKTLGTRSANAYIEKFKTLQVKAKEYESLLGIYVGAIHQQITEALTIVDDNNDSNDTN